MPPPCPPFFIFLFITRGLEPLTVRETPPGACFLFPAGQLILLIREKSRKTDPERIRRGSINSHRKPFTDARKYVPHPQTTESKSLGTLPREMMQISHSDASGQNANSSGAARYLTMKVRSRCETCRPPTAPTCRGPRGGRAAVKVDRSPQTPVY